MTIIFAAAYLAESTPANNKRFALGEILSAPFKGFVTFLLAALWFSLLLAIPWVSGFCSRSRPVRRACVDGLLP
jgi:hypothetical protein